MDRAAAELGLERQRALVLADDDPARDRQALASWNPDSVARSADASWSAASSPARAASTRDRVLGEGSVAASSRISWRAAWIRSSVIYTRKPRSQAMASGSLVNSRVGTVVLLSPMKKFPNTLATGDLMRSASAERPFAVSGPA